mmetsp:Transcript_5102/g.11243  ORF Transcript_5102/g.11243 Transcript_5102/m.11243 type:complete len:202 (-) Transcript_5102:1119-1724(-)
MRSSSLSSTCSRPWSSTILSTLWIATPSNSSRLHSMLQPCSLTSARKRLDQISTGSGTPLAGSGRHWKNSGWASWSFPIQTLVNRASSFSRALIWCGRCRASTSRCRLETRSSMAPPTSSTFWGSSTMRTIQLKTRTASLSLSRRGSRARSSRSARRPSLTRSKTRRSSRPSIPSSLSSSPASTLRPSENSSHSWRLSVAP